MAVPQSSRLDRDAVIASLRTSDVVGHFRLDGKRMGDELRFGVCPKCGPRTRKDAISINMQSGRWADHAHGCSGDLLSLIAGFSGLDPKRDFPRVLEIAASIAGIGTDSDPAETARALERRRAEEAAVEVRRKLERAAAIKGAAQQWPRLKIRSPFGEGYLQNRALDSEELVARGLVRFWEDGSPTVALWSSDGTVLNCVRRCVVGDKKVKGIFNCPTAGTLVGSLDKFVSGQLVVLTEGVIDTLTACLAWPEALVLGAHGAGEMPTVANYVVKRIGSSGSILLVGHNDPPKDGKEGIGPRRADIVRKTAREAGVHVAIAHVSPHNDLNDAWKGGWRP